MSGTASMTDEDLMARVQGGDHEAFSVLVERYTNMFFTAAYRMCGQQDDAEDIVQDAFLKLWKNPSLWDPTRGAKFSTWFYRVVTNQAIDHTRKKKPVYTSDTLDQHEDERTGQLEELANREQNEILETAIQSLPERQKTALNLCFYEGVSNKEAADIMGVGVKALESLLMRAKSGLKDELIRTGLLQDEEVKERHYGSH